MTSQLICIVLTVHTIIMWDSIDSDNQICKRVFRIYTLLGQGLTINWHVCGWTVNIKKIKIPSSSVPVGIAIDLLERPLVNTLDNEPRLILFFFFKSEELPPLRSWLEEVLSNVSINGVSELLLSLPPKSLGVINTVKIQHISSL